MKSSYCPAKVVQSNEWQKRSMDKSQLGMVNLNEEPAKGYDSPWLTWRCLNRLRTGYTCSKEIGLLQWRHVRVESPSNKQSRNNKGQIMSWMQDKWSYCVLLITSPCPLYYFPFLLRYACTLYLHVCIIFTTVLYSSYQLMIYPLWLKLLYCYTVTVYEDVPRWVFMG